MDNIPGIVSETIILIFNILIYMQLTVLKRDNAVSRVIMYSGSAVMLGLYFVFTYIYKMPQATTSFMFVTLPSFVLFFILSKYKDFRFVVTFCFLDTITFIITFFSKAALVLGGKTVGVSAAVIISALLFVLYLKGKNLFAHYRELLINVKDGWASMAIATLAIYFLLVFAASYPKPLMERTEYFVSYGAMALTLLCVYIVFVLSLVQKKNLCDLNEQLLNEQKWHRIAYEDALTGLENRTSYVERINELERIEKHDEPIHILVMDVDNFKHINDTLGHSFGDTTLQRTAEYLRKNFSDDNCTVYRLGGDEFAVIIIGMPENVIEERIEHISKNSGNELGCSLSIGGSKVCFDNDNAVELAFEVADRKMYENKSKKKAAR